MALNFALGVASAVAAAVAGPWIYTKLDCDGRWRQSAIVHDNYVSYRTCPEFEREEEIISFDRRYPYLYVYSAWTGRRMPTPEEYTDDIKRTQQARVY
jgi:hypothetical protein